MLGKNKKHEVLTVPNLLSFFRLALVPLMLFLYIRYHLYWLVAVLMVLSGATDIVDGYIARKFDCVTEVGKLLDPVADKMTQGILILCLTYRYRLMIPVVILFAAKEIMMVCLGSRLSKEKDMFISARWYGKMNTCIVEGTVFLLILIPKFPETVATVLMISCMVSITFTALCYALLMRKLLKNA